MLPSGHKMVVIVLNPWLPVHDLQKNKNTQNYRMYREVTHEVLHLAKELLLLDGCWGR